MDWRPDIKGNATLARFSTLAISHPVSIQDIYYFPAHMAAHFKVCTCMH
jgi:hypothetical protein